MTSSEMRMLITILAMKTGWEATGAFLFSNTLPPEFRRSLHLLAVLPLHVVCRYAQ